MTTPAAHVRCCCPPLQARDVDAETALHGLAAPLGVCGLVGVGGLALNGGLSLLSRAVGAVCDNILEATLVTADGAVVGGLHQLARRLGRWRRLALAGTACRLPEPCPGYPSQTFPFFAAARGDPRLRPRAVLGAARRGCAAAARLPHTACMPCRPPLACLPLGPAQRTSPAPACQPNSCPPCLPCQWPSPGAGSALGVVTKLKLRLHPTAGFHCGTLVFADDAAHAAYKCAPCCMHGCGRGGAVGRSSTAAPGEAAAQGATQSGACTSSANPCRRLLCRGILRWMRDTVLPDPSIGLNVCRALHPEHGPVVVCMVRCSCVGLVPPRCCSACTCCPLLGALHTAALPLAAFPLPLCFPFRTDRHHGPRVNRDQGSQDPAAALAGPRARAPCSPPHFEPPPAGACRKGPERTAAAGRLPELALLWHLNPAQDTVGAASWLETQRTHEPAILGRKAALPVHYEAWVGAHFGAEQVRRWLGGCGGCGAPPALLHASASSLRCMLLLAPAAPPPTNTHNPNTLPQLTDAFLDDWVEVTADALPPQCALTLAFFELLGGALQAADSPAGFLAGERAGRLRACCRCLQLPRTRCRPSAAHRLPLPCMPPLPPPCRPAVRGAGGVGRPRGARRRQGLRGAAARGAGAPLAHAKLLVRQHGPAPRCAVETPAGWMAWAGRFGVGAGGMRPSSCLPACLFQLSPTPHHAPYALCSDPAGPRRGGGARAGRGQPAAPGGSQGARRPGRRLFSHPPRTRAGGGGGGGGAVSCPAGGTRALRNPCICTPEFAPQPRLQPLWAAPAPASAICPPPPLLCIHLVIRDTSTM